MKLETTKTFLLIVLIGISLLLTFGLWNNQPQTNKLLKDPPLVNEVDIGGQEEMKKSIIQPNSIIFHKKDQHFGFSDPKDQKRLYQDMQSWTMYNFKTNEVTGKKPKNDEMVEVIFPTAISMEVFNSIFTFDEEVLLPAWSFKRIYFTFEPEKASLKVHFLSENGQQRAEAIINDSTNYDRLWSVMSSLRGLDEYILFNGASPIYLPSKTVNLEKRRLTVKDIDPNELVNAVFKDPSIVRANPSETYFTDSQRGMHIEHNGKSMEFVIPYKSENEQMDQLLLLENSITNMNDHKGWTENYKLSSIETTIDRNRVRYQMYYDGFPVHNSSNLASIEQEWRGPVLTKYVRPLFRLKDLLDSEPVDIPSGSDVVFYLKNNLSSNIKKDNIEDIQLGYRLHYINNDSLVILEPAWYMNYSGNWREFIFEDVTQIKGGD